MIFRFPSLGLFLFVVLICIQDYKLRWNIEHNWLREWKAFVNSWTNLFILFFLPNGIFFVLTLNTNVTQSPPPSLISPPNLLDVSTLPSQFYLCTHAIFALKFSCCGNIPVVLQAPFCVFNSSRLTNLN